MSVATSQSASRRPCDQCTLRKIRCNYELPTCNRCVDVGLQCTHSIPRKKRGPRKGRGAVLDNLRSSDNPGLSQDAGSHLHEASNTSEHQLSPLVPGRTSPDANDPRHSAPLAGGQEAPQHTPLTFEDFLTFDEFAQHVLTDSNYFVDVPDATAHGSSGQFGSTPHHSSVDAVLDGTPQTAVVTNFAFADGMGDFEVTPLVERSVHLFFEHIYPIYPLLSKDTVDGWLQNPASLSKSAQTLVWSICATTLAIVDSWPSLGYEQRAITARNFIRRCHRLRVEWDYMEEPCFEDILTALFIANTFFDLKQRKASWMHVREAISLAIGAGLHNEASYADLDHETRLCRRRTYALLYITERGASIQDGFPVSILLPPTLPNSSLPNEDASIAHGLGSLHGLFSLLDFKFVKLWNEPGNHAFASSGYADLLLLQSHLRELRIEQTGLSEVQRSDILITQQWLRLIFWQAALRQGYISTSAQDPAFTYSYPVEVAMELCRVVKSLPPVAIQAHGLGIFEKQFEIAYSLMDALALSEMPQAEHHECLRYLLLSLSASPNSRQLYVRTLESKISNQQKYRRLTGVQLFRDERGSRQNSRRSSRVYNGRILDV